MGGRANRRRGEIEAMIDGERRILCLTLGALAELETAFGVDNIAALAGKLSSGQINAAGLISLIGAGLRGGGNLISDAEVGECHVDGGVEGAIALAVQLLSSAFGGQPEANNGRAEPRP